MYKMQWSYISVQDNSFFLLSRPKKTKIRRSATLMPYCDMHPLIVEIFGKSLKFHMSVLESQDFFCVEKSVVWTYIENWTP